MERGTGKTTRQLVDMVHYLRPGDRVYYLCPTREAVPYTVALMEYLTGKTNPLSHNKDGVPLALVRKDGWTFAADPIRAQIVFTCPDVRPFHKGPGTEVIFDHAFADHVSSFGRGYDEWVEAAKQTVPPLKMALAARRF